MFEWFKHSGLQIEVSRAFWRSNWKACQSYFSFYAICENKYLGGGSRIVGRRSRLCRIQPLQSGLVYLRVVVVNTPPEIVLEPFGDGRRAVGAVHSRMVLEAISADILHQVR